MTDQNPQPVTPTPTPQPNAANPATAGNIAQANAPKTSMSTTIHSLEDLKNQAPEVYKAMMQGIAINIIDSMQHSQYRLKQAWRGRQ